MISDLNQIVRGYIILIFETEPFIQYCLADLLSFQCECSYKKSGLISGSTALMYNYYIKLGKKNIISVKGDSDDKYLKDTVNGKCLCPRCKKYAVTVYEVGIVD